MHMVTDDAIGYVSTPGEIQSFNTFHKPQFAELRKRYYTYMMHGSRDAGAYIYDKPDEFMPILKSWYKNYGKGRAILMVVCWAGFDLAKRVAAANNVPALAGLGLVHFGTSSQTGDYLAVGNEDYHQQHGNTEYFEPFWIFHKPDGTYQQLPGGNILSIAEAIKLVESS